MKNKVQNSLEVEKKLVLLTSIRGKCWSCNTVMGESALDRSVYLSLF